MDSEEELAWLLHGYKDWCYGPIPPWFAGGDIGERNNPNNRWIAGRIGLEWTRREKLVWLQRHAGQIDAAVERERHREFMARRAAELRGVNASCSGTVPDVGPTPTPAAATRKANVNPPLPAVA